MSTNKQNELSELQSAAATQPFVGNDEQLESAVKAGTVAQVVVAIIAVIGLVYLLKLVLVTTLVSLLFAYVLEPIVNALQKVRIPRWLGSLIAVLLVIAIAGFLTYFALTRAVDFLNQLPTYANKLRGMVEKFPIHAGEIEKQIRTGLGGQRQDQQPVVVQEQPLSSVGGLLAQSGGTITDTLLAIGFMPFLVYFMLTWKEHFQRATVWLFPREHRLRAHDTVGRISAMIRSYIVANVLIGILGAVVLTVVFGLLGLQYFYFLGVLSGFISLIPYLGLFLAMLPPLAAGLGSLDRGGMIAVIVTITALHVVAVNVLYPKVVGKRLKLNPVVVSLSLLFWSWIWGAPGLVLAIPLLGSAKIVCDHVQALRGLSAWLGESTSPG